VVEMTWKYGMILVGVEEWEEEYADGSVLHSEPICELVELYSNKKGEYTSFCKPSITSPKVLQRAAQTVLEDGINTWFFENGIFTWNSETQFWNWCHEKDIN
jgi:hypothetical protein